MAKKSSRYSEALWPDTAKDVFDIMTMLTYAFDWEETPQGHDAWMAVYDALDEIRQAAIDDAAVARK